MPRRARVLLPRAILFPSSGPLQTQGLLIIDGYIPRSKEKNVCHHSSTFSAFKAFRTPIFPSSLLFWQTTSRTRATLPVLGNVGAKNCIGYSGSIPPIAIIHMHHCSSFTARDYNTCDLTLCLDGSQFHDPTSRTPSASLGSPKT